MPGRRPTTAMDDGLAVGGGALVLGSVSLWIAGPPGMFACGLALVIAGTVGGSDRGAGETGRNPTGKANCPECGARNDRDAERCHHCEADLGSTADGPETDDRRETDDGQDRQ